MNLETQNQPKTQETLEEKAARLEAENLELRKENERIPVLEKENRHLSARLRREEWTREVVEIANEDLVEQVRTLSPLAFQDPLLGIGNRRALELVLSEIFEPKKEDAPERRVERVEDSDTAYIIFDIDYFKSVNDTFGHDVGDKILREVTATLRGNIRGYDVACRFGGEEIVVILRDISKKEAIEKAEMLRKVVSEIKFIRGDSDVGKYPEQITISGGVSFVSDSDDSKSLMKKADEALYESKKGGRNKVTIVE